MIRTRTALGVALASLGMHATPSLAADPIPPALVGVWATDGAVLKGQALFEGQALYLGADGVGAVVGGPPPIGFKIVATFDARKNELGFDPVEGAKRGPHTTLAFDPATGTIDLGTPGHDKLHRRFDTLPEATRHALGLQ